jgi:hypothetical protein
MKTTQENTTDNGIMNVSISAKYKNHITYIRCSHWFTHPNQHTYINTHVHIHTYTENSSHNRDKETENAKNCDMYAREIPWCGASCALSCSCQANNSGFAANERRYVWLRELRFTQKHAKPTNTLLNHLFIHWFI